MQTMSLEKFRDALTVAAKSKGEPGVIAQKKLILDRYMIVDAEGVAIDPETLDVHLMPAAPQMEEDAAKPEEGDPMNQEEITKSVRSAVAAELKAAPRVAAVTAAPQAWETAKVYGKLKNFAEKERAWRFGTWCLGAMGHKKSADFCNANGLALRTKGHTEGVRRRIPRSRRVRERAHHPPRAVRRLPPQRAHLADGLGHAPHPEAFVDSDRVLRRRGFGRHRVPAGLR